MKRRIVALMLVGSMVLALSACGGSDTNTDSNASSGAGSTDTSGNVDDSSSDSSSGNETTAVEKETDVDYESLNAELEGLQDEDAYEFFAGLADRGLSSSEILGFFAQMPISPANEQINQIYEEEGLGIYNDEYLTCDKYDTYDGYVFDIGNMEPVEITGPITGWTVNLPMTDYIPYVKTTVGDESQTYNIGVCVGTSLSAWSANLCDATVWQFDQIENVEYNYQEMGLEGATGYTSIIDAYLATGVDAIITNPTYPAATADAADAAYEAGIPFFTVDSLCDSENITCELQGAHDVEGIMLALALIQQLHDEGNYAVNMVMIRQFLGASSDCLRTGFFLKTLSYFSEINVLQSYHDTYSRTDALANCDAAFQTYDNIDVIYCGAGDEATVAYESAKSNNRLQRANGEDLIIVGCDDSKENLRAMENENAYLALSPYTPFMADAGARLVLKYLDGEDIPDKVLIPAVPLITQDGEDLFGIETMTADQWIDIAFGE